jgi:hypothetical protein
MATAEASKYFVNFIGGLNTEATPLNFPENSAQELDNFDLFITGEVKRRLGLEFEDSYTVRPETISSDNLDNYAVSTSEWRAVNGKGDINFLMVQTGLTLYFHDLGAEPVSSTLRGTVTLDAYKTGLAPENKVVSTAYGEGVLIVANSELDPVLVEYDEDTDTFSTSRIELKIRDFKGVEDGLDTDTRPVTLSNEHKYNLRNQGWPKTTTVSKKDDGDGTYRNNDPIAYTRSRLGVYPSNADLFYAAKLGSSNDAESIGAYSPWDLEKQLYGNTPAPQGHFILDLFNKNRTSVSGINVGATETTSARPSNVAFYAGRVFYAGVPDKSYTGDVYFSQSLEDTDKAGLCYQEYDPTAEDLNALLATDGGVIHIADLGEVYWMDQVGQDLIIVSNTGVYAISGATGRGNFQADEFSVRKITNEGTIGRESVVEAENSLFWWGDGGIWIMQGSQITEELVVERISRATIQSYYDSIEPKARAYVRSFYDRYNKKIYWLYNDTPGYDALSFRFRYNRALVLDLSTQSVTFYTYTFSDLNANTPWVAAMSQKEPGTEAVVTYDVWQGEDDVVQGGTPDDVVEDIAFPQIADVKIKLLTFVQNEDTTYSYTFSEFKSRDFTDWKVWDQLRNNISNTGADYNSVIQTGWNDLQDPLRDKQISTLQSYFNRTEDGFEDLGGDVVGYTNPSSALVSTRWQWTNLDTGQWTTPTQAYKLQRQYIPEDFLDPFDYGYTVVTTKLRMRGRGQSFSIRYESESGKDMQLIGFAIHVTAGARA